MFLKSASFTAWLLLTTTIMLSQNKDTTMTLHATGTFEVTLKPLEAYNKDARANLGRMSIDKHFLGNLEAVSKGEMLTAGTDVKGSAVYVAVERVSGTLNGKKGTFSLHHTGIMTRNTPQLSISVVPDSGTDELLGITGTMTINIVEGKHFYDFEYALPDRRIGSKP